MRYWIAFLFVACAGSAWGLEARMAERLESSAQSLEEAQANLVKAMTARKVAVPAELGKAIQALVGKARAEAGALRKGKALDFDAVRRFTRPLNSARRMIRQLANRDEQLGDAAPPAAQTIYGELLKHMTAAIAASARGDKKTALKEQGLGRVAMLKLEQVATDRQLAEEFKEFTGPLQARKEDPKVQALLKKIEERFAALKKSLTLRNELEQEQAMLEAKRELLDLQRENHEKLMEDIDREFEEIEEEMEGLMEQAEMFFDEEEFEGEFDDDEGEGGFDDDDEEEFEDERGDRDDEEEKDERKAGGVF